MHRFFKDLNPTMEARFEALMTNERAEHFLMNRTLSDVALITQDNYEDIYRDIEEAAAERVSEKKDREIASLKTTHTQQLDTYKTKIDEIDEVAQAARQEAKELAHNIQGLADEKEQLTDENRGLAERLDESDLRWATACLKRGQRVARVIYCVLTVFIALVAAFASVIGGDSLALLLTIAGLTFATAIGFAVLGSRIWPTNPLDRWIARRRDAAVQRFAHESGVEHVLTKFTLDWDARTVREVDENANAG